MNADDAVEYLRAKIRAYEDRISELRARRDALDGTMNQTQALLNSAQVLLKDELRSAGGEESSTESQSLAVRLADLTLTDSIFEIVNSSPGPIHADLILKTLREADKAPKGKQPKNSVVSLLLRGVAAGLYDKVGPNLFASVREQKEADKAE